MKKNLMLVLILAGTGILVHAQTPAPPPPPPPPPAPPEIEVVRFTPPVIVADQQADKEFMKRNPSVTKIHIKDERITLVLKNKKAESYNLAVAADKQAFEKKYGAAPARQEPIVIEDENEGSFTPPTIVKDDEVGTFTPPTITKDTETDDFMKRNPTVKGIHFRNDIIILSFKDNKKETYNLANESEKKLFESKYGKAPTPPPPPPAPKAPKSDS